MEHKWCGPASIEGLGQSVIGLAKRELDTKWFVHIDESRVFFPKDLRQNS